MVKGAKRVELSYKTILFTIATFLGLWVLYEVRQVLLMLFISVIFMGALNPFVSRLTAYRLPRWLAILVIYATIFSVFLVAIAGILPPLVSQTNNLAKNLPQLFGKVKIVGLTPQDIGEQFKIIDSLPREILRLTLSLFQNLLSVFLIFVITFYLLHEHKNLDRYSFSLFGSRGNKRAIKIITSVEQKLGDWVRAQVLLMVLVAILSYLGFAFLGLGYALPLAILAGLLELVPNIGPTVATIPAVLAGLTISPLTGLAALAWGFLVQQLENNFIVPKVMKETVGLNPLVTLVSLTTGFHLGGVMGAVLAIPLYLTAETVVQNLQTSKRSGRK